MVGSKASDIAKGLALIVEVAAIFLRFCSAGNNIRSLRFWWTISQQQQNQKQQNIGTKTTTCGGGRFVGQSL